MGSFAILKRMAGDKQVHDFIERIMQVRVLRMGGSASGILGVAGPEDRTVYELKRSAVALGRLLQTNRHSVEEVQNLATDIEGHIKTLQLTSTISMKLGDSLVDQLQSIVQTAYL